MEPRGSGQKIGDAGAVVTGALEDLTAVGGEFFSFGAASPVAVPLSVHGTVTVGQGLKNLFSNPIRKVEGEKPAQEKQQEPSRTSNNSKNEKHGDGGRAQTKAEKQISQLQEQLKTATGNDKKVINKKIQNIRETAAAKAKGEEHSRANKR